MTIFLLAWLASILLYPVSLSVPVTEQLQPFQDVIIDEVDMSDFDMSRMTKLPLHTNHVKRRAPDHDRLCPVEVIRLQSKDFFKDRFSQSAVIIPSTFKTVKCLNITVPSHLAKGGHCLNIMDCQETMTRKYFMVFDPAKRETNGCLRGRIAQINSVPVECSCLWPRYLGNNPSLFLHRQH